MAEQSILTIRIHQQEYKIKLGDQDPEYIKKLATYVNQKIKEFEENFSGLPLQKLMIVVCLNIADEFFKSQSKDASSQSTDALQVEKLLLSIKEQLSSDNSDQ